MTKEKLLKNWDAYFPGQKGERFFRNFWRPLSSDVYGAEKQSSFKNVIGKKS
jgi:hypothetical protein